MKSPQKTTTTLLDTIKTMADKLIAVEKELADLKTALPDQFTALRDELPDLDKVLDSIRGKDGDSIQGEQGQKGDQGEIGPQGPQGEAGKDGKDGAPGRDGKDGAAGPQGPQGDTGAAGSFTSISPEEIRNHLELLEGDDRLDAKAIKGLDEFVSSRAPKNGTNFVISRGQVKAYDLSASLDGVTKTFALPAFYRVLLVDISSGPVKLRFNTDYTIDGTLMKITFTSTVDAATQLSAGQTCIILYQEP